MGMRLVKPESQDYELILEDLEETNQVRDHHLQYYSIYMLTL